MKEIFGSLKKKKQELQSMNLIIELTARLSLYVPYIKVFLYNKHFISTKIHIIYTPTITNPMIFLTKQQIESQEKKLTELYFSLIPKRKRK